MGLLLESDDYLLTEGGDHFLLEIGHSRGSYSTLPGDDSELETPYQDSDLVKIAVDDADMVSQSAIDEFALHQFKIDATGKNYVNLTWTGQSNIAPSHSTVYLQIYDYTLGSWTTIDSELLAAADTDFTLAPPPVTPLDDYKDADGIMAIRVYQEAK